MLLLMEVNTVVHMWVVLGWTILIAKLALSCSSVNKNGVSAGPLYHVTHGSAYGLGLIHVV